LTHHLPALLLGLALLSGVPFIGCQDDFESIELDPQVSNLSWRLHDEIESLVYASWEQDAETSGWVEYAFDEGEWLASPRTTFAPGAHEQILLGIPYDTEVTLRVVSDLDGGAVTSDEVTAVTGPVPEELPLPEVLVAEPDLWETTGPYLLGSINPTPGGWFFGHYWMFIVDRQGRVVWARRGIDYNFTIYLRVTAGGDILWDEATFWSELDDGAASRVHRMRIDGEVTASHDTPGMHHAFVDLPDGSLLWGSAQTEYETLERLHPDGTRETVWDCTEFYQAHGLGGWCHSNAMFYREQTDSLLYSFPDPDMVLELDLQTGEVLDWWSHLNESWAVDPEDATFWFQHGATFTDAGTLLLSSHATEVDDDGVVREYEIDRDASVLRQIWHHGVGDGIDAEYAGEAHRLPSGNTLHNTGTTPRVREITPDGAVVWDIAWEGYRLLGRTVLLDDLYTLAP